MLDYYRFKEIYDLVLRGRVEEAREILMEMQEKYIELCDENSFLKSRIEEYEDILYLTKNLIFDGAHYWLMTGRIKQGPFCRNCYDIGGQLIRLEVNGQSFKCNTCGSIFKQRDARETQDFELESDEAFLSNKVIHLFK